MPWLCLRGTAKEQAKICGAAAHWDVLIKTQLINDRGSARLTSCANRKPMRSIVGSGCVGEIPARVLPFRSTDHTGHQHSPSDGAWQSPGLGRLGAPST